MNISHALAWMGQRNVAAGLWGQDDHEQVLRHMRSWSGVVETKLTVVAGQTRQNITVVDTADGREMHLRKTSRLASTKALRRLRTELSRLVHEGDVCVFAGAMPAGPLLAEIGRIVQLCAGRGAGIVVDTYGPALKATTETGLARLICPNVEELSELLGEQVRDTPVSLAAGARRQLAKVGGVLISRGPKGAIFVTEGGVWIGRCAVRRKALATVGCGDYLLAGFLKGLKDKSDSAAAVRMAVKVATARAWGWTETKTWPQARRQIRVDIKRQ
jgi:fructose-1-phosphate kinase PfkB-like protein